MTEQTIDTKAFRPLSYGVYIITAEHNGKKAGCVVNTFQQVTSKPARVSVAINKENFTCGVVLESGRFEAAILAEDTPVELIGRFGFQSSAEVDKFADTQYDIDAAGVPYVSEYAVAHVGARVIEKVDVGSHYLIVGEVECAEVLSNEPPMTYAYYHQVKGGKTPPKASSFEPEEETASPSKETVEASPTSDGKRYGWKCLVCGYIEEGYDELPEDYRCPRCGVGRENFERIELDATS